MTVFKVQYLVCNYKGNLKFFPRMLLQEKKKVIVIRFIGYKFQSTLQ